MLSLNSISFGFGKKTIFNDLTLQFDNGKVYGMVGANGVGKTTLFRTISGIYKADQGQITYDKHPLHTTQVAFLPTDPFFYPYMKGIEYLKITTKNEEQLERAIHLSTALNVPIENLVDTYSTGMKKKLAFVSIHVHNKVVNIYDEPFNGVDLESNEILLKMLKKEKSQGITFVSSHILSMLFEFCDEILHIEKGFEICTYQPSDYNSLMDKIRAEI